MEDDVQQLVEQTKATLDLILGESQELPIEVQAEILRSALNAFRNELDDPNVAEDIVVFLGNVEGTLQDCVIRIHELA